MARHCWTWISLMPLLIVVSVTSGCQSRETRIDIVNYRAEGETEHFHETFGECFYTIKPDGNVDIVARRCTEDGPDGAITQIMHVQTIYRVETGRINLDRTMINARVSYAIVSDTGGSCFEGWGFVFCRRKHGRDMLEGDLEQATVRPNRRTRAGVDIFTQAELSGKLIARRDKKKVVQILNELDRVFGPRPDYQPPPAGSDVL